MGLGVVCRTYQEIVEIKINQTIITTRQQCAASQSNICIDTGMSDNVNCSSTKQTLPQICNDVNATCPQLNPLRDNTPIVALGCVVGILLTLLVVLVIGSSLSCVALVKRNSVNSNQPDELDTNITPNPAYHTVDAIRGSIINYETVV